MCNINANQISSHACDLIHNIYTEKISVLPGISDTTCLKIHYNIFKAHMANEPKLRALGIRELRNLTQVSLSLARENEKERTCARASKWTSVKVDNAKVSIARARSCHALFPPCATKYRVNIRDEWQCVRCSPRWKKECNRKLLVFHFWLGRFSSGTLVLPRRLLNQSKCTDYELISEERNNWE